MSEPVIITPKIYCSPSPSRKTKNGCEMDITNIEMAKLMATINSLKDGSKKVQMVKRYQKTQRQKLGIDEKKLRKVNYFSYYL